MEELTSEEEDAFFLEEEEEKLKTLKEIELRMPMDFMRYHKLRKTDPMVTKKDLRAEAVKWVKDCHEEFGLWNKPCKTKWEGETKFCSACSRFIKFFNLTEEDLI